jgi:hypothetical protein
VAYAVDLQGDRSRARADEVPAQAEAELRARLRGEERLPRALQILVRVDVGAPAGVNLEVEVGIPVRVAGVAVPRDLLAGCDLRAVRDRERGLLAAPAVVVARGEVVVQMDVHVHRPARAVEVEHATAQAGVPVLHAARLDRDDGRPPGRHDVDSRVGPVPARVAVVVPPLRLRHQREDEARHAGGVGRRGPRREERGRQAGEEEGEKYSHGCRPVASHDEVRSGARSKRGKLAEMQEVCLPRPYPRLVRKARG